MAEITGTPGDDVLVGTEDDDLIEGLAGDDEVSGREGNDVLDGEAGDDVLQGGDGRDRLIGGDGSDNLFGGPDPDRLSGGPGNDVMLGEGGDDIYEVDSAGDRITEASSGGIDLVRSTITYILPTNVEHLSLRGLGDLNGTGNNSKNTIIGNDGANTLSGLNGQDALLGEGGNDILRGGGENDGLNGGPGIDTLNGGDGKDRFFYESPSEGGDTIQDYLPKKDTLVFSSEGFDGGLQLLEPLVVGKTFVANTDPSPTTTEGTFLYDTDAQDLFWDRDGTGDRGAVLIAHFDTPVTLTVDDFAVV
jgi:Ca2+-binding RTX toxin-like protein